MVPVIDGAGAKQGYHLPFRVIVSVLQVLVHEDHALEYLEVVVSLRQVVALAAADSRLEQLTKKNKRKGKTSSFSNTGHTDKSSKKAHRQRFPL